MDDDVTQTRIGCGSAALLAFATLWLMLVIGLGAPLEWFVHELMVAAFGLPWPLWASPAVALGQAVLVLMVVGLLAAVTRQELLRAIYRSWAAAAGLLVLFGMVRGLPPGWSQAATLLTTILGGLVLLGLRAVGSTQPRRANAGDQRLAFGAASLGMGLLVTLPWLSFGALGSPLDTLLAFSAAAAIGASGVALLDYLLVPSVLRSDIPWASRIALAGLGYSGVLLLLAAGAGFQSSNLLLLATLPPLGLAAASLALPATGTPRRLAPALLLGVAAAAPLAWFDGDEITLLLGANELPDQALGAASWALGLGLLLSVILWIVTILRVGRRIVMPVAAPVAPPAQAWSVPITPTPAAAPGMPLGLGVGLLAAGLLSASLSYLLLGHPGFYGERLFVILRDQVEVGAAQQITDRDERLAYVYTTLTSHATTTQAELRASLAQVGVNPRPYYLVNGLEVDESLLARLVLLTRPEVDRVLASPRLRPLPAPPPPEPGLDPAPSGVGWNIRMIGADRVWNELGVTGAGIVIGQSDSGVDAAHPALQAGYRGTTEDHTYHWFDPWFGTTEPRDYGMHGTHTLGSAAGSGGIGVAPDATWFACSNLARNLGNPARYLDCMQFMLAPHPADGDPFTTGEPSLAAHVLNNSWGCPPLEGCDPQSLEPAVGALRAAGIFVVASAGNEGDRCSSVSSPLAIYADAFSVGAVNEFGSVADFSSRGPVDVDGSGRTKPDVLAPGDSVLSAAPANSYAIASGTSMAGPHVAGVVALIWSANPALIGEIEATEAILRETAQPYTGPDAIACAGSAPGSNVAGAGLVDAYAAVQAGLAYGR